MRGTSPHEGNKKKIILTGFGSFSGVSKNPTEQIIDHFIAEDSKVADEYSVLRVATKDVSEFCASSHPQNDAVFIHLGVSGLAKSVCLEQYAYNNMTFRAPDEDGFEPQEEKIMTSFAFDERIGTDLPVESICTRINDRYQVSQYQEPMVALSDDPGRYVCNYIYFHSLQHYDQKGKPKECVFIHVPPVQTMDLLTQIDIVSQCVCLVREHCESN